MLTVGQKQCDGETFVMESQGFTWEVPCIKTSSISFPSGHTALVLLQLTNICSLGVIKKFLSLMYLILNTAVPSQDWKTRANSKTRHLNLCQNGDVRSVGQSINQPIKMNSEHLKRHLC